MAKVIPKELEISTTNYRPMIPLNMINKIMYKQLLILNKIEKIYKYQSENTTLPSKHSLRLL